MNFDITQIDFAQVLITWTILLFSLCLHEFGHAWVAYLCGDDTAKHHGRITMNPVAHADLMGTVILPLFMMSFAPIGFGWAKPVPVNPSNLRNYPRDDVLVSLAGIFMNLVLAAVGIVAVRVCIVVAASTGADLSAVVDISMRLIMLNLVLAVFNLMPAPPLDGWHVIKHAFSIQWRIRNEAKVFQYGPLFLILIVLTRAHHIVLYPAMDFAMWLIRL